MTTENSMSQRFKSGKYVGKMIIQCGREDRIVSFFGWLDEDGMISRLVKENFGERDVYIIDRFDDDCFPPDWSTKKHTIDDVLSWVQKANITPTDQPKKPENADKYPQYFRAVMGITHLDVYGVHKLFNVQDPSGCIQHASKKLLLSGVRTGGKSAYKDIKEARDTLNRWLELYAETPESS